MTQSNQNPLQCPLKQNSYIKASLNSDGKSADKEENLVGFGDETQ